MSTPTQPYTTSTNTSVSQKAEKESLKSTPDQPIPQRAASVSIPLGEAGNLLHSSHSADRSTRNNGDQVYNSLQTNEADKDDEKDEPPAPLIRRITTSIFDPGMNYRKPVTMLTSTSIFGVCKLILNVCVSSCSPLDQLITLGLIFILYVIHFIVIYYKWDKSPDFDELHKVYYHLAVLTVQIVTISPTPATCYVEEREWSIISLIALGVLLVVTIIKWIHYRFDHEDVNE